MAATSCSAQAAAMPNKGVMIQKNWVTTCFYCSVLVMVSNSIMHVGISCQTEISTKAEKVVGMYFND